MDRRTENDPQFRVQGGCVEPAVRLAIPSAAGVRISLTTFARAFDNGKLKSLERSDDEISRYSRSSNAGAHGRRGHCDDPNQPALKPRCLLA